MNFVTSTQAKLNILRKGGGLEKDFSQMEIE
jgi:hypothetical protein